MSELSHCQNELAVLTIAYRNSINDLARAKDQLKQAEITLLGLAQIIHDVAANLGTQQRDDPGCGGSGGNYVPR